jgi:hypothetical protein
LATCTRPDIQFAVGELSRFLNNPGWNHWIAGYSDADWGGDTDTRRSTSGYIFTLDGNVVSWKSRRQPVVALSTAEAELIAVVEAIKEALYLRSFLVELKFPVEEPIVIYVDNQAAIVMAKEPAFRQRSKHMGIRYHFVSDLIAEGVIMLKYIPTKDQLADFLTKPPTGVKLKKCLVDLGVVDTAQQ